MQARTVLETQQVIARIMTKLKTLPNLDILIPVSRLFLRNSLASLLQNKHVTKEPPVSDRHAARSRIRSSQSHPGLRVDHYPFSVSHVSRLLGEDVSLPFKRSPSVAVYAQRLELDSIRHPLMMEARRIDRLLNVHSEVDYVHDHLQHRVDDRRTAGASDCKPYLAIFQNDCRSHRRKRTLARGDGVVLALKQSVGVGHSGLRSEVVHFVVQQHTCTASGRT